MTQSADEQTLRMLDPATRKQKFQTESQIFHSFSFKFLGTKHLLFMINFILPQLADVTAAGPSWEKVNMAEFR